MNNNESRDLKAHIIEETIKRSPSFRMYLWEETVKPTKVNSDLTVVCTKILINYSTDSTVTETKWDVIIVDMYELTFKPNINYYETKLKW